MADKKFDQSGGEQFKRGRENEKKLQITDPESHRLDNGNPDIGDVDLGVIEADKPTRKDDNSPLTEPEAQREFPECLAVPRNSSFRPMVY